MSAYKTVTNTQKNHAAPQPLSRPLLPVQQMVKQTYLTVSYHADDIRRLGAMPLAIIAVVQTLYVFSPTIANLLFATFGNLLASSTFAVGLNRLVINNQRPGTFGIEFGRREWTFFFMLVMATAPLFLLTACLFGGGLMLARWLGIEPAWHIAVVAGTCAALLFASYVAVRFSLIFPSLALDNPINVKGALSHTRNQSRRIWLGLLMCLMPSIIITSMIATAAFSYKMPFWTVELIHVAGAISALPLGVIFLALNYERLVLGRIINRNYAVLPKGRQGQRKTRGNSALFYRARQFAFLPQRLVLFSIAFIQLCLKSMEVKREKQKMLRAVQRQCQTQKNMAAAKATSRKASNQKLKSQTVKTGVKTMPAAPRQKQPVHKPVHKSPSIHRSAAGDMTRRIPANHAASEKTRAPVTPGIMADETTAILTTRSNHALRRSVARGGHTHSLRNLTEK